jgi:hypothetical protein
MKKVLKIVAVILFVAFVGIQFNRPNRTNPPINQSETLEASNEVPNHIEKILKRSCKDCHSNETVYPWYSNVAPISWQVVDHIRVGRDELNFSIWNTYSKERKERKLGQICEEVESGEMPHNQYLWIHREAILSDADKKALCDWTKTAITSLTK